MRVWGFHQLGRRTDAGSCEAASLRPRCELDGDVARCPNAHTQLDFGGLGVGYGSTGRWACSTRAACDVRSST